MNFFEIFSFFEIFIGKNQIFVENNKKPLKTMRNSQRNMNMHDFELIKVRDFTKSTSQNDSELGKGSYGKVKLVKERNSNKLFALKIVKILYKSTNFQ